MCGLFTLSENSAIGIRNGSIKSMELMAKRHDLKACQTIAEHQLAAAKLAGRNVILWQPEIRNSVLDAYKKHIMENYSMALWYGQHAFFAAAIAVMVIGFKTLILAPAAVAIGFACSYLNAKRLQAYNDKFYEQAILQRIQELQTKSASST